MILIENSYKKNIQLMNVFYYVNNILISYIMASWKGFEPLTDGLEGRCSIQLSYQDIFASVYIILYLKIKVKQNLHFSHTFFYSPLHLVKKNMRCLSYSNCPIIIIFRSNSF